MSNQPAFIDIAAEFIRARRSLEYLIYRRVRCQHTAADLASDMYVKLIRRHPVANSPGEAWSYLNQMAKRIAIDHVRNEKRRQEILQEAHDVIQPQDDIDPEPAILAHDEMRVVSAALTELPDKCREILIRSRMHGMTHNEIAAHMGISKSLIEKYLMRTLQHCQQRLREAREEPFTEILPNAGPQPESPSGATRRSETRNL